MSEPHPPHDDALRRFDERYDALAASNRRAPARYGVEGGAGAGYRLIGELIGGVLTGLGLGWLLDRFAGTSPFGLIGGLLIGAGVAIYMVVRSAGRMAGAVSPQPVSPAVAQALDEDGPD